MERHLERMEWSPNPDRPPDLRRWPFTVPAVAQLVTQDGLEIPAGVACLIGENGSGKSTLVEAFAAAYPRRGASTERGPEPSDEDSELRWHLRARRSRHASPAGFFLRAETMHAYLAEIDANPDAHGLAWRNERVSERSHGESFLTVLEQRFIEPGVYFMDEPESALSFSSSLALLGLLGQMQREGSQVILATHSPLLAALPGATLLETGEWGIRRARFDDLELVRSWREFLEQPGRYLRHLLAE
jgi:predicted ATPase